MSAATHAIRVLVADDHPIVRAGIRTVLRSQQDMLITGEVSDGSQLPAAVERLSPKVLLPSRSARTPTTST